MIDFAGENLKTIPPVEIKATVSSDKAKIRNIVSHQNPETGGIRVSFQLLPGGEKTVELRAQLMRGEELISEAWMDRWTP